MSEENGNIDANINLVEDKETLERQLFKLQTTVEEMKRINSGLAHLTIDETYKNFYDWKVKPAVDIIALLSSAAQNTSRVATDHSNNVYAKKRDVRRALDLTDKLLDQVEMALKLYEIEVACLIEYNKNENVNNLYKE
ncbi:MAG: hypothetical protein ACRCYE_09675 [Sarcina sp.]